MLIPATVRELAIRSAVGLLRRAGGDMSVTTLSEHMRSRYDASNVYPADEWYEIAVWVYRGYWNAKQAGAGDGVRYTRRPTETGGADGSGRAK